jgi:hypothetical protein
MARFIYKDTAEYLAELKRQPSPKKSKKKSTPRPPEPDYATVLAQLREAASRKQLQAEQTASRTPAKPCWVYDENPGWRPPPLRPAPTLSLYRGRRLPDDAPPHCRWWN